MKNFISNQQYWMYKVDRRTLQLLLVLVTLALFVIGAGAPGEGSPPGQ